MSAFVVEDITINRVVGFLATHRDADRIGSVITSELSLAISEREHRQKLAEAMYALNCNAVDQRYGEGESAAFRDNPVFQYKPVAQVTTPVQAFKSLQCWLYQCAEGDVPDTSLLYATMKRVSGMLAKMIVESLPTYDKAVWG